MTGALTCSSCGASLARDSRLCGHCGTPAVRRRCGTCFDLNLIDDQACRRCGSRLPTAHDEEGGAPGPCPGCGALMSPRSLDGVPFTECDACGGLWLTPAVLERVKERASERQRQRPVDSLGQVTGLSPAASSAGRAGTPGSSPAVAAERVAYRRCPACRSMMNRSHLASGSGFVADLCRQHGVYFDSGELARLFTFVERGGLLKARLREEEALRARVSAIRREALRNDPHEPLQAEPPSLLEALAQVVGRWFASR